MNSCFSINSYRGKMIVYILFRLMKSWLLLLPPYCYLLFLNEVIMMRRLEKLWFVVLLYVFVFTLKALVSVLIQKVYNQIFPVMIMEVKERVLEKYGSLDIEVLQGYTAGELKESLHKDSGNVVLYWEKKLDVWISLVNIFATTGVLLYMNWILAIICFLFLPLSFLITRYIKEKGDIEYENRRQVVGFYNDFMIHNMYFWKEVKSNCMEQNQQKQFEILWKDMGNSFLKVHMYWFMNRTLLAFKDVFLTKMSLYLLGGILVIKQMTTVPVLLAFMEYYTDFVNQLLNVTDNVMKRGEQEESIRRIERIMQMNQPEKPYGIATFEYIAFRHVDFSYSEEQDFVLQDFCINIRKGECVAVVGESGCGKSTFIKLMAGWLLPTKGEILWNGRPMHLIDKKTIFNRVGFLMQEPSLFNLTIRENLLFGKADASASEMIEACTKANIIQFIEDLPLGFETRIGENGICLSGGQKQRLVIARLFLQNPEVIVFDEATSLLDYQNESDILNILLQDSREKTFIMVTHRGTSVSKCSRVFDFIRTSAWNRV